MPLNEILFIESVEGLITHACLLLAYICFFGRRMMNPLWAFYSVYVNY
jgi:hypothetical protein